MVFRVNKRNIILTISAGETIGYLGEVDHPLPQEDIEPGVAMILWVAFSDSSRS